MKKILLSVALLMGALTPVLGLNVYRGANFMDYGGKDVFKSSSSFLSADSMKETGLNTMVIPVTWFQNSTSANQIYNKTNGWWQTPSDDAAGRIISYAKSIGLKTVIKLHVDVTNGASRTDIVPANFTIWWTNYRNAVMHYAALARDRNADMFIIGTELTGVSTNQYTSYWTVLAREVKSVYSGLVSYSANWDNFEKVGFWSELDLIGIDAYFPLLMGNMKVKNEIKEAWSFCRVIGSYYGKNWLQTLRNFSVSQKRNIVFTEIGYRSFSADVPADSVLAKPWEYAVTAGHTDMEIQAKAYSAFIETFLREDWFDGFFLWRWHPDPNAGGWNDSDFTPQNKPAAEVLKSLKNYDEDIRKDVLEIVEKPEKVDYIKGEPISFQFLSHEEGEMKLNIYNENYKKVYEKTEEFGDEEVKSVTIPYSSLKTKISRGLYFYKIEFNSFKTTGRFVIIK
ncbi:MAG: hypothetical protein PHF84_06505 [bacterium]|nr:hypothetical protein [bacterium]